MSFAIGDKVTFMGTSNPVFTVKNADRVGRVELERPGNWGQFRVPSALLETHDPHPTPEAGSVWVGVSDVYLNTRVFVVRVGSDVHFVSSGSQSFQKLSPENFHDSFRKVY